MLNGVNLDLGKIRELDTNTTSTDEVLETFLRHRGNRDVKNLEWMKLLCKIGDVNEFIDILSSSKSNVLAIMKYRRILYQRRINSISFLEINTAYTNKQTDRLHKLLQELFLEYISEGQFKFILDKINNKEGAIEKIYNRHLQDKGLRILTLILTL